ncbi:MAG: arginine deiminase-related protein [Lachnobacterium sp.]|nr:arginine deiminase-related protein [Lachnobacterium sp.]
MSTERKYGAQSMYGTLKKALIHRPGPEFSDHDNYRKFGFTGPFPVLEEAQHEHDIFASYLKEWGVEVEYAEDCPLEFTGLTYITDNGIITDKGAIISRPGKPQRIGEEAVVAKKLLSMDIPILYSVFAPGTVEGGGETIWLDHDTLLIGNTYRTNDAAYEQLKKLLEPEIKVIQFQLPSYLGPGTVLHLGSVCSLLDKDLAVVYSKLMPIAMYRLLEERGIEMIDITDEEFSHSASNILAVAPRKLIMLDGNPRVKEELEKRGCEVKVMPGNWTGYDRHAGPTCMTMSVLREYE